jgi:ATP-binding cassette subfamily B protein
VDGIAQALRARARKAVAQLPLLARALRLVWRAAPRPTALWAALIVLQGLLPVALVFLTRAAVDAVAAALGAGAGWERAREPVLLVAALAAVLLLAEVAQAAARWVRTVQAELVRDQLAAQVQERAVAADLAYFESPAYFDQLYLIRVELLDRPLALLESLGTLLQSSLTLVAMLAVLLRFGAWVPVVLAVSTAPALWVVLRSVVRHHDWRVRTLGDERRAAYFDWLLTGDVGAAEVRLFSLGEHFAGRYREVRARLRAERFALTRQENLGGLLAAAASLAVTGVALAVVVWRALAGALTLGEVAMFYQAFSQGQRLARALLETAGETYADSLFLGRLFAFLERPPTITRPAQPLPLPSRAAHGVELREVTFRYPGRGRPVLERFSLAIPAGRVVAVVGPNGAGKSTLIKLLCRFYDPDEGAIEIDGIDLRRLDPAALRRAITVLMQEPVHYGETFSDNVRLGDLEHPGGEDAVASATRAAGADDVAARLPRGAATLLGRWFEGGVELSVGEWQRVALARAFFRDASLVLLDEPTSAMDSWAEQAWMERFRSLVEGRTALLITHRFTTAMRADVIHVMADGRVVESGSHAELLASGGRYAASWHGQVGAANPGRPSGP